MASAQRPGEITYYEELGVASSASADQIRDSFRSVARLLHPDQQTDPQLKETAEQQMRKLNRIYAVLSDPARRTAYDESLTVSRNAPIIVFSGSDGNLKRLMTRLAALGAIIFGAFLLIWFMATSNNTEVRGEVRGLSVGKANDGADGDAGEQIARLREQLRIAETERNAALQQLGRLSGKQTYEISGGKLRDAASGSGAGAPAADSLSAATDLKELPSVGGSLNGGPAPEPAVGKMQFAGVWVYSKSSGSAVSSGGKSQYPPEFIEVTLAEVNGAIHGEYRSRYQVLDHAISPDVNFDFNGKPSGSSLSCAWRGPGGARGHLMFRIQPDGMTEMTWNATELGSQQWLISGNAMLVRK